MLSEKTYADLARLTEEALHQIPGREAIDKVTAIRGYVQLLSGHPSRKDYEANLAEALFDLSDIATRYRPELASRLGALSKCNRGISSLTRPPAAGCGIARCLRWSVA